MKIVFFEAGEAEKGVFGSAFPDSEVVFLSEKLNEQTAELAAGAEVVSVFVGCSVNKSVINALPDLKLIATRSTGYDHIDCEYAKSKGILVASVPGYGAHTVAEFAFGLILSLGRNISSANAQVRQNPRVSYNPAHQGFELCGKTLGVIGTGRIGKNVVKIAKGFGMEVVAYDLFPDENFAKENGFAYKSLDEVLALSDIITLHAAHTKENHHLLNEEHVNKMKKGVMVINTARGELIDTKALYAGLEKGVIAGAGLDVLENERELKAGNQDEISELNRLLIARLDVLVTPHIAFFTQEAVAEIQKITKDNIESYIAGSPVNVVNK